MKGQFLSTLLAAVVPLAAHAGGPTSAEPEPSVTPAAAPPAILDWSGVYAGVMLGAANGDMRYYVYDVPDTQEAVSGSLAGTFAGFNMQRGSWVYGGELAYSTGDVEYLDGYGFTTFIDLKARLGHAAGRALVYGTLGMTRGEWEEVGFASISGSGLAYGVGVDLAVSERMVLGVEYLWRSFETDNFESGIPQVANTSVHGDFGTLSLRLGFRF